MFNLPGLGDSKRSELMDAMLALPGTHKPCFIFKQLPNYVRAPSATSVLNDYWALAQEADQMYLSGRHHPAYIIQEVNATGYKSSKAPRHNTSNMCWYHHRFGKKANKCCHISKHYDNYNKNRITFATGPKVYHTTTGPHEQQLVVTDNTTGRRFLVDTGAQVLVVPSS